MREADDDEHGAPLLTRIAGGDVDAMRALYLRHAEAVQRFVNTRIRDEFEVADITHETMLRVWHVASKFERRSSVRS